MRHGSGVTGDGLRPSRTAVETAWARRVVEARRQIERVSAAVPGPTSYGYADRRFRQDPRRTSDELLEALLAVSRPSDTWLDIGAGVGRFALPLALHTRGVIALEPSSEALRLLGEDARFAGIDGITTVEAAWPLDGAPAPTADVALMAHVGYGVEDIGPFLDAAEASAVRACVMVMGERPMSIAPPLLWPRVHGEERISGPAFRELLSVLLARGVLPTVSYAGRPPVVRASRAELAVMARRQLRVVPGSAEDARLIEAVGEIATRGESGWALDWTTTRIGIAVWRPAGAPYPTSSPGSGEST